MTVCSEQSNKPLSQIIHQYEVRQLNDWWDAGRFKPSGRNILGFNTLLLFTRYWTSASDFTSHFHTILSSSLKLKLLWPDLFRLLIFWLSRYHFYQDKKETKCSRNIWSINSIINCFLPHVSTCQFLTWLNTKSKLYFSSPFLRSI